MCAVFKSKASYDLVSYVVLYKLHNCVTEAMEGVSGVPAFMQLTSKGMGLGHGSFCIRRVSYRDK